MSLIKSDNVMLSVRLRDDSFFPKDENFPCDAVDYGGMHWRNNILRLLLPSFQQASFLLVRVLHNMYYIFIAP